VPDERRARVTARTALGREHRRHHSRGIAQRRGQDERRYDGTLEAVGHSLDGPGELRSIGTGEHILHTGTQGLLQHRGRELVDHEYKAEI
jgi:hypothetical protein